MTQSEYHITYQLPKFDIIIHESTNDVPLYYLEDSISAKDVSLFEGDKSGRVVCKMHLSKKGFLRHAVVTMVMDGKEILMYRKGISHKRYTFTFENQQYAWVVEGVKGSFVLYKNDEVLAKYKLAGGQNTNGILYAMNDNISLDFLFSSWSAAHLSIRA